MREKLLNVSEEYDRLSHEMSTQEVASDPDAYRHCAKAQSEIGDLVKCFRECDSLAKRLVDAEQMLREESDPAPH